MTIHADVSSLYQVWLGRLPLLVALRAGRVRLEGTTAAARRMAGALRLSPLAATVVAAQ